MPEKPTKTINIPTELHKQIKVIIAETGSTIQTFVEASIVEFIWKQQNYKK